MAAVELGGQLSVSVCRSPLCVRHGTADFLGGCLGAFGESCPLTPDPSPPFRGRGGEYVFLSCWGTRVAPLAPCGGEGGFELSVVSQGWGLVTGAG